MLVISVVPKESMRNQAGEASIKGSVYPLQVWSFSKHSSWEGMISRRLCSLWTIQAAAAEVAAIPLEPDFFWLRYAFVDTS